MTIPLGRYRLVVALVPPGRPPAPDLPAAVGATDAELVRLSTTDPADMDLARWDAMRLTYGPRRC